MISENFGQEVSVHIMPAGNCTCRLMTSTAYQSQSLSQTQSLSQSQSQSQPSLEHGAASFVIGCRVVVLQLNTEDISKAKTQVIEYLVSKWSYCYLAQETHATNLNALKIPGYSLAAYTSSRIHGAATLMSSSLRWHTIASSSPTNDLEWITTEMEGITITNVYKPPDTRFHLESLPQYPKPCIYAGNFNCCSSTWGYTCTNSDGNILEDWASATDTTLLYDPKQPYSFCSA